MRLFIDFVSNYNQLKDSNCIRKDFINVPEMNNHIFIFLLFFILSGCKKSDSGNEEMAHQLKKLHQKNQVIDNYFANHLRLQHFDSLRKIAPDNLEYWSQAGKEAIRAGENDKAIAIYNELIDKALSAGYDEQSEALRNVKDNLALAYLRKGEIDNCIHYHSSASCIIPLQPAGFHQLPDGSTRAAELYQELLATHPDNLKYQWLYNIAAMTLGQYPEMVNEKWRLEPTIFKNDTAETKLSRFENIAGDVGVAVNELSGGVILDDFNNDYYPDIVVSSWDLQDQLRFFVSEIVNDHITYIEKTAKAGLTGITGGLNLVQADYNNDGWMDLLVLRGAWLMNNGKHPNSLLRNNGDGTFSDVTKEAGLLSYHPTQTAVWRDFNNDGWLDVFIGNEAMTPMDNNSCELFINQKDGTFKNFARQANVLVNRFVKGVTAADYNNDGKQDLYVSTLYGKNYLFENAGNHPQGYPEFIDVTSTAGLDQELGSFPCWFWDYNNDGWQDIFVNEFLFEVSRESGIMEKVAADYLGQDNQGATPHLFKNNGDGTFTEVTKPVNLDQVSYTMGSNFGDFNNDGWLDCYLATGEPALSGVMPNRAFLNISGQTYKDVTASTGLGHIQKGHAVAFADLNLDGDQDIYTVLGGAFEGDNYFNALFENPILKADQEDNQQYQWITILLEGEQTNKSGIGAKLVVNVLENGVKRSIFREMNSGGSFGSNPLRLTIGLGAAEIQSIEVYWPTPDLQQIFTHIPANRVIKIIEKQPEAEIINLKAYPFLQSDGMHHHAGS